MEEEEDNPPKQVCYEVGLGLYMWENFPPKRNLFMYQRNRLLREGRMAGDGHSFDEILQVAIQISIFMPFVVL